MSQSFSGSKLFDEHRECSELSKNKSDLGITSRGIRTSSNVRGSGIRFSSLTTKTTKF